MQCDACRNEAVISQQYSGRHMCRRHFVADLEAKAKRSIRAYRWLDSGDHIGVMVSGDKHSGALLYFMKKLTQDRRDIRLSVIPADGGISSGGNGLSAERIAALMELPCIPLVSDDSGTLLHDQPDEGAYPAARITKIAMAFALEDMARGVLARFLRGNLDRLVHPSSTPRGSLPVICPFGSIPSAELELYWDGLETGLDLLPYTLERDAFMDRVAGLLGEYNTRHPATHHALLHIGEQLADGKMASLVMTRVEDGGYEISRCGPCGLVRGVNGNGA